MRFCRCPVLSDRAERDWPFGMVASRALCWTTGSRLSDECACKHRVLIFRALNSRAARKARVDSNWVPKLCAEIACHFLDLWSRKECAGQLVVIWVVGVNCFLLSWSRQACHEPCWDLSPRNAFVWKISVALCVPS